MMLSHGLRRKNFEDYLYIKEKQLIMLSSFWLLKKDQRKLVFSTLKVFSALTNHEQVRAL